jgi:glutamate synthase (NADPH/NADH) small chain
LKPSKHIACIWALLDAEIAIKALGFDPEDLPTLFNAPELGVSKWGTINVQEPNKMTNLEGVFAAGDIYRGASLVVWAIKDGRDAADGIHQYIQTSAKRADAA